MQHVRIFLHTPSFNIIEIKIYLSQCESTQQCCNQLEYFGHDDHQDQQYNQLKEKLL